VGEIPMTKTELIKFVATKSQRERIQQDAQERGYVHLSAYMRDILLNNSRFFEEKLVQLEKKLEMLLENNHEK
jgi:hypothetical protein